MDIFCMAVRLRPVPQYKNPTYVGFLYCGTEYAKLLCVYDGGEDIFLMSVIANVKGVQIL